MLMLMLAVMLLSALHVMAEETVIFEDNFENYADNAFFSDATRNGHPVKDSSGTTKWTINRFLTAEIVNVPSKSGNGNTKAMKISTRKDANDGSVPSANGGTRFSFSSSGTWNTSGIRVWEYNLYYKSVGTDYGTYEEKYDKTVSFFRAGSINNGYHKIGNYDSPTNLVALNEGWNNVKIVFEIGNSVATMYVNDEIAVYRSTTCPTITDSVKSLVQMSAGTTLNSSNTVSYIIIDDVKVWHTPDANELISSTPSNTSTGVSRRPTITLNFEAPLLDITAISGDTLSEDNFVLSDGLSGNVGIDTLTVSDDKKTVTLTLDADLNYETPYTLCATNLIDIYDRIIPDRYITFTTKEMPVIDVEAPVFRTENLLTGSRRIIDRLESGYISCNYSIRNNQTSETEDVILFVVLKENDEIIGFQFKELNIAPSENGTMYAGFYVPSVTAATKIEAYAWDNMTSMNPISEDTYIFTSEGLQ